MRARLSDLLKPGTLIVLVENHGPFETKSELLILSYEGWQGSFMRDGRLHEVIVMDRTGKLKMMTIHDKELSGQSWFASRVLKFIS